MVDLEQQRVRSHHPRRSLPPQSGRVLVRIDWVWGTEILDMQEISSDRVVDQLDA